MIEKSLGQRKEGTDPCRMPQATIISSDIRSAHKLVGNGAWHIAINFVR